MASKNPGYSAVQSNASKYESAVDTAITRTLASSGAAQTADDTYIPPTELRTRGKDMQSALNAAMFGTSRALGRGRVADRLYAEAEKEDTNKTTTIATNQLREMLLVQADRESKLIQDGLRSRAAEDVLKDRLKQEQIGHEEDKRGLKEAEGQLKALHQQNEDRIRKMEASQKSITLLEMRIRDLQQQMEETIEQEHKTTEHNLETNRSVRELEREMLDLSTDNAKITDMLEDKVEKNDRMFQDNERSKDELLRGKQRADVQAIALEHELTAQQLAKEPLDMKYADTLAEYRRVQNDMKTMQQVHEQQKIELEKRLADEEAANNALVEEIAQKATVESQLAADLAEELNARDVIVAQMEDKDGLCLEMGKRLHKLENVFAELSNDLKQRDGETEELMQLVESMKSTSKVLNAKLEMEQSSTRKLVSWTQMERLTADDLDQKLVALRNNETANALTMKQEEAMGQRLKEKLSDTCKVVASVKEELHNTLAEKDFKEEKLKEVQGDLKLLNEKYSKQAAIVEKLQRQLNERTRTFENKHKQFLLAQNELQGKVAEKDDEVARLTAKMKKSNGQVANMQSMLEESAEKSEKERVAKSAEINALDDINTNLESELRQQTNRNKLMETDLKNSEDRIKFASKRMITNEDKAADMAKLNSEEILELQLRLKRETESLTALTNQYNNDKLKLSKLIAQFDQEDHAKRRMQMTLRQEKHEHDTISQTLEDNKEKELDRVKRTQEQEAERDRLQMHADSKSEQLEKTKTALSDAIEKADGLKKSLHDAEVKESDLFSQQAIDQATIHQLEGEINIQEEQHVQDANSVKLKIVQLQDALQEKVATVEKLEKAVAAMRQKANSLQIRLEQTETESAHCQTSFERMLDEEQQVVAGLRVNIEKLTREIMSMRQSDLNKDEEVMAMESKLSERQSENETLISEAYRKDRQAHNDTISVQRLTVKERDMLQTVQDLGETVVELKLQQRETEHAEQDYHRQLVELENENKLMKHQIQEKMKAERILLLELEAQRHHVNDSSGHATADKHAEEALEKLLHAETDKAI